ncbi:SGNH/GDSL hydrolase family protein [Terrabacter sp. NPDC000476]|uniref:SGNH/GDSL hydrolase family protein n=1 Tax=Terrabacter sp. NPDC000476 TaxID=3154258 RepID=UPI00332480EA
MTVYSFASVLVWDSVGGAVRVARRQAIDVTDPNTGLTATGLAQNGVPVASLTADESGRVTFTATIPVVRLVTARGFTQDIPSNDLWSSYTGGGTPMAAANESSSTKALRSDDPRVNITILAAASNLDDLVQTSTVAALLSGGHTNMPPEPGSSFEVHTNRAGSTSGTQLAYSMGASGSVWLRVRGSSGYAAWKRIDAQYAIDSTAATVDAALPAPTAARPGAGFKTVPLALTVGGPAATYPSTTRGIRIPLDYAPVITRWRVHLRNINPRFGLNNTGAISLTGLWVGAHNGSGGFTGSLTQVSGAATTPADGSEWVSPWCALPIGGGGSFLLAYGFTAAAGAYTQQIPGGGYTTTNAVDANNNAASKAVATTMPLHVWIEAEVPAATPVIAGLGDSLSAGIGATVPVRDSVVSQYARANGALPVHYAASGDTAAAWADREQYKWKAWAQLAKPDAVLIGMGSNDINGGATLGTVQADYATLVANAVKLLSPNVYAATILPRDAVTGAPEDTRRAFNAWLKSTPPAAVRDVFDYVPGVSPDDETLTPALQADGIHLTTAGYAANVAAITRPLVAPSPPAIAAPEEVTGAKALAANDPRIVEARRNISLTQPGGTDSQTAVGVRVPFRAPFATSKFRIHLRNRNPATGQVYTGAISGSAIGIGTAQMSGTDPLASLVEASGTTLQGSFTTPADGSEWVSGWITSFPLASGTWYSLSYGLTSPAGQTNYAGAGASWMNTLPTSVLNKTMASVFQQAQSPLDVWIEAVAVGGVAASLVYAGRTPAATAVNPVTASSRTSISTFGDSLTDGGANGIVWPETDSWPYKLGTLLPGVTVTNLGYSGATVDEMLIKVGARRPRFTVTGGSVPSSGTVAVTTVEDLGIPTSRQIGMNGKLGGLTGRLLVDYVNGHTFTTYGAAPVTAVTGPVEFVGEDDGHYGDTAVIWIGRNDVTFAVKGPDATVPDHVVGGVQQLVEWLTPQVKQVMILGTTTRTNEPTGNAMNSQVLEINSRLRTLYPSRFKSVQDYLMNQAMADLGLTPTTADTTNIANGTLPPSLLEGSDNTHISKATAAAVAQYLVAPYLKSKGWI